jgi:hypothetical protein
VIRKVSILGLVLTGLALSASALAQSAVKAPADAKTKADIRGSAAYAELLLKRTEAESELEALSAEYTDEYPKVVEAKFAFEVIERERNRLLSLKPADLPRLTTALGKLIVRKVEHEVELWTLRRSLQDAHPDVKRARRKTEIFEAAIKEILGQN